MASAKKTQAPVSALPVAPVAPIDGNVAADQVSQAKAVQEAITEPSAEVLPVHGPALPEEVEDLTPEELALLEQLAAKRASKIAAVKALAEKAEQEARDRLNELLAGFQGQSKVLPFSKVLALGLELVKANPQIGNMPLREVLGQSAHKAIASEQEGERTRAANVTLVEVSLAHETAAKAKLGADGKRWTRAQFATASGMADVARAGLVLRRLVENNTVEKQGEKAATTYQWNTPIAS